MLNGLIIGTKCMEEKDESTESDRPTKGGRDIVTKNKNICAKKLRCNKGAIGLSEEVVGLFIVVQ